MKRLAVRVYFALFVLSLSTPALSQATQPDSQTLREILSELRAMHNDVRLTALSQILLTELQTQQTVVNQAMERASNARLQLSNLQADEKLVSADLASAQEKLRDEADPVKAKALSETVDRMKSGLVALKAREDTLSTNLQSADSQVRSAQEMLDDIQRRLDSTVKKLQPIADAH